MNRIERAIDQRRAAIAERLATKTVTQEKLNDLHKVLDMAPDEHAKFQQLKSEAFLNQMLTLDEAQTMYAYLGESVDVFNKQPLEVKSVLTSMFAELLALVIRTRS